MGERFKERSRLYCFQHGMTVLCIIVVVFCVFLGVRKSGFPEEKYSAFQRTVLDHREVIVNETGIDGVCYYIDSYLFHLYSDEEIRRFCRIIAYQDLANYPYCVLRFSNGTEVRFSNSKEVDPGAVIRLARSYKSPSLQESTSLYEYLDILAKTDYLVFVAVSDEASSGFTTGLSESFRKCGFDSDPSGNYQQSFLGIRNSDGKHGTVLKSEEELSIEGEEGEISYVLYSAGRTSGSVGCSILLNGLECATEGRGVHFAVVDPQSAQLVDVVTFDTYLPTIPCSREYSGLDYNLDTPDMKQVSNLSQYLALLKNKKGITILAVYDEASSAISDRTMFYLKRLGITSDLKDNVRGSFYAVLLNGECISEKMGTSRLEYEGTVAGVPVSVVSAGYDAGADVSVVVNGSDYACFSRGLNIVYFDAEGRRLVDSVVFDTYVSENNCFRLEQ